MTEDQAHWEYFRSAFRRDHPNSAAAIEIIDGIMSHTICPLEDHRWCEVLDIGAKRTLWHARLFVQRTGDGHHPEGILVNHNDQS